MIVTVWECVTASVVIVKVALVAPLGIVTVPCTVAARAFEVSTTTETPAAGAGALMVTVPETGVEEPPTSEPGDALKDATS